jgi:hypothetical protein
MNRWLALSLDAPWVRYGAAERLLRAVSACVDSPAERPSHWIEFIAFAGRYER